MTSSSRPLSPRPPSPRPASRRRSNPQALSPRVATPEGTPTGTEGEDAQFFVRMFKHEFDPKKPWKRPPDTEDIAVVLTSQGWGPSTEPLSSSLLSDFLVTMVERLEKPRFVILLNSAVKLAAQSGPIFDHLRSLEAMGVKILLNRSSLTHHNLEREVRVGEPCTMMDIVGHLLKVAKVISL